MTQTKEERKQLAYENKRFGSHWTDARPERQHSGTILWAFVAIGLCAAVSVILLVLP